MRALVIYRLTINHTRKSDKRDLFRSEIKLGGKTAEKDPAGKSQRENTSEEIYGTMSMSSGRLNEEKCTQFRINYNNSIILPPVMCAPGLGSGRETTWKTKDQHDGITCMHVRVNNSQP